MRGKRRNEVWQKKEGLERKQRPVQLTCSHTCMHALHTHANMTHTYMYACTHCTCVHNACSTRHICTHTRMHTDAHTHPLPSSPGVLPTPTTGEDSRFFSGQVGLRCWNGVLGPVHWVRTGPLCSCRELLGDPEGISSPGRTPGCRGAQWSPGGDAKRLGGEKCRWPWKGSGRLGEWCGRASRYQL